MWVTKRTHLYGTENNYVLYKYRVMWNAYCLMQYLNSYHRVRFVQQLLYLIFILYLAFESEGLMFLTELYFIRHDRCQMSLITDLR